MTTPTRRRKTAASKQRTAPAGDAATPGTAAATSASTAAEHTDTQEPSDEGEHDVAGPTPDSSDRDVAGPDDVDELPAPLGYLVHLDPTILLGHRKNLRTNLGDLTELTGSIASEGVMQAITVLPEPDGVYRVVAGHRRTAAAAEALAAGTWPAGMSRTVPCLVRPDLVGRPIDQVLMMLGENEHRRGLAPSEEAEGYAQLAAFDLPPEEIARRTSRPLPHVKTSLRLHALPAAAKRHADAGRLTLEDVTALEEFADDPAVLERCLNAAGNSWGVKHEISEARRKRQVAAEYRKVHAGLLAADVKVVPKPKGWERNESQAAELSGLRGQDGKPVDLDAVKTLNGFAAFIETNHYGAHAVYVCLDPDGMGLKRTRHTNYRSAQERAAAAAEAKAKEGFLAALVDSNKVRREFLVEVWGSLAGAQSVFTEALRLAVTRPGHLVRSDTDMVSAIAGADVEDGATATHDRLVRLLVARWVCAEEDNVMAVARSMRSFSAVPERLLRWFDRLVEAGYMLSAAEASLREQVQAHFEAESARDDDQDEDQDDRDQDEDDQDGNSKSPSDGDGYAAASDPCDEQGPGE